MPPLSKDDKEWVRLMVQEAIVMSLKEHVRTCPNAARLKVFMFGLLCGVGALSGPGIVSAIAAVFVAR